MDPLDSQIKPVSLATVMGGENVSVSYRDGSTESVFVYDCPIEDIGAWGTLYYGGDMADEPLLVERFYCRRPKGWAATLTTESYEAIVALGEGRNRPIFARAKSRLDARGLDGAGIMRRDAEVKAQLSGVKLSVMPSPESASPATSHLPTP